MNIKKYLAGRKVSACVLSVALALSLLMASAAEAASNTLSWTFNYSVDPVCSTTVTTNCVNGFEYGTTPDAGKTLVKSESRRIPRPPAATPRPASACNLLKDLRMARWCTTHALQDPMATETRFSPRPLSHRPCRSRPRRQATLR
jgi:hypothetical protein